MFLCHVAVAGPGSLFYLGCCFLLVLLLKLDVVLSHHCFYNFCYRKMEVLMMSMADSNQPSKRYHKKKMIMTKLRITCY